MASVTYGKYIMASVIMAKILWQMKLSPISFCRLHADYPIQHTACRPIQTCKHACRLIPSCRLHTEYNPILQRLHTETYPILQTAWITIRPASSMQTNTILQAACRPIPSCRLHADQSHPLGRMRNNPVL